MYHIIFWKYDNILFRIIQFQVVYYVDKRILNMIVCIDLFVI